MIPQKIYPGTDTDKHGTRLDVYIEENMTNESENDITVYDVEPDKNINDINILPKRVRFYHAKIDAHSLKSGESYRMLKKVIVIMITPYDPFGLNHMLYTIRNKCEEIPEMPYDDGARTVFLYTKGTEGNPSAELKQFLHYMEHTTEENATTDNLRSIHQMVNLIKQDEEVSLQYMKIFEREEMLIQQGIEQGIEQGIQQGRKEEQANTELERQRAEKEKARADQLEKELQHLKDQLKEFQ
ncbi:MAG: Rpn family recombination-promoting nuclease/putative transposase [Oliverpabstia sp.]|nr:Rpn family recombination-promoting nuclease/putative transposase [Oliverpabstia sp.]